MHCALLFPPNASFKKYLSSKTWLFQKAATPPPFFFLPYSESFILFSVRTHSAAFFRTEWKYTKAETKHRRLQECLIGKYTSATFIH